MRYSELVFILLVGENYYEFITILFSKLLVINGEKIITTENQCKKIWRCKNAKQPRKSFTAFSGKEIYNNPKTGKQVVYDTDGNYFRIEDTTLTGKRVYTDINGNQIPNNKFVNGK